jgi:hypothetical protein
LQGILGRRPVRIAAVRDRSRHPVVEQLEGRAVPASYVAASVPDLIAAINAANRTAEADTITLAAGTTFTLTAVDNTTDGPTGLPVIEDRGGDLTIVGNGDVMERSTATGTPAFRLFDVSAGASLKLTNLTLQGGLALGTVISPTAPMPARGGAIFSRGASTLDGVIVQSDTAQGAEGYHGWWAGPGGQAAGGGIYSEGTLTLEGSTIRTNTALGGKGADGFVIGADLGAGYAGGAGGVASRTGADRASVVALSRSATLLLRPTPRVAEPAARARTSRIRRMKRSPDRSCLAGMAARAKAADRTRPEQR